MARDPWVRIARNLNRITRRAVAQSHRAQGRSIDAESQAQVIQARKDRLSILKNHAYERGKAAGTREAQRSAKVVDESAGR